METKTIYQLVRKLSYQSPNVTAEEILLGEEYSKGIEQFIRDFQGQLCLDLSETNATRGNICLVDLSETNAKEGYICLDGLEEAFIVYFRENWFFGYKNYTELIGKIYNDIDNIRVLKNNKAPVHLKIMIKFKTIINLQKETDFE